MVLYSGGKVTRKNERILTFSDFQPPCMLTFCHAKADCRRKYISFFLSKKKKEKKKKRKKRKILNRIG
jgi:hypothetical protein